LKPRIEGGGWRATHKATVASNPWFSVEQYDVVLPDESPRLYHTLHFAGPAVGIIAATETHLLLVHQYRFIVDEYVWAIPSGGVSNDESLDKAAARELLEEAACTVSELKPLFGYYPSYGCGDQRFEIFHALNPKSVEFPIDANEVIRAQWFAHDDVKALLAEQKIVDGLSLTALLYFYLFVYRNQS
jgi:ADP-ribose pyrophosphatase